MPESTSEQQQIMSDLLRDAIPISPSTSRGDYVTRSEMSNALQQLETRLDIRLENSMLKIRNWVITGMLAGGILFGGGFITTIIKIDRVAESMPVITQQLERRRVWSEEKNAHDYKQDRVIGKLDPQYEPEPMKMP